METVTPVGSTTPTVQTPTTEQTDESALASDFETFLQLLTTQLQNQDPSKPLDSTEFVSQLASFSAVEQQINTNKKLEQLIASSGVTATSNLIGWIGANVKSPASAFYNGNDLEVFYKVPEDATSAELIVRNDAGSEILRQSIDKDNSQFVWNGLASDGSAVPDGNYSFEIDAFEGDALLSTTPAETFSKVIEARNTDEGVKLVFDDGSSIGVADVGAVRS